MRRRLSLERVRPDPDTPSALGYYWALREDDGEAGLRIRDVLDALRCEPGKVREHSLRYRPGDWWAAEVQMPDASTWWVVWRERGDDLVQARYIGPEPGA